MFQVLNCLTTQHDWRLVVVAGVVCFVSALTAISLFHRARTALGGVRPTWIVAAGVTVGCGIWATHFIAMLAYEPGVPVAYGINQTALSLIAAMVITAIGLGVAAASTASWGAPTGGAIVGGGVACMHYLGMWALEVPGHVTWSFGLVVTSVVLGMLFGMAAMAVAVRQGGKAATVFAAVLLTLAIVSHHFTAMGAVQIIPDPGRTVNEFSLSPVSLAVAIAGTALGLLALTLAAAFAREDHVRLTAALDNMSQGLCMWSAEGRLILCNKRYVQMYNLSLELTRPGVSLRDLLDHRIKVGSFSGSRDQYIADLLTGIAKSKTITKVHEHEGRFIAISNRPMGDGGWVATHEDVTEQRVAELQRSSMQEMESRRAVTDAAIAGFRNRVEIVLKSVGDSGQAMQSTAVGLLGASEQPRNAQRARSRLRARHPPTSRSPPPPPPNSPSRSPRSAISSPAQPRRSASL